jgi:stage IV sporulation protein FB
MLSFRFLGFPVRVHWMFWLMGALLVGGNYMDRRDALILVPICLAATFVSVLVHELGHAWFMRRYGAYAEIILHGMGGAAIPSGAQFSRQQSLMITAAGPGVQLLLGLAIISLLRQWPQFFVTGSYTQFFLARLQWVSIAWALFNLLPIYPMDGGHIFNDVFGKIRLTGLVGAITAGAVIVGLFALNMVSLFMILFLGSMGYSCFLTWKNGYYDRSNSIL